MRTKWFDDSSVYLYALVFNAPDVFGGTENDRQRSARTAALRTRQRTADPRRGQHGRVTHLPVQEPRSRGATLPGLDRVTNMGGEMTWPPGSRLCPTPGQAHVGSVDADNGRCQHGDESGKPKALQLLLRRDATKEREYLERRPNVAGDSW